jgi:glutamine amidotransferase
LHSYFYKPREEAHVAAVAHYGVDFAATIHKGNIWATQFHPEKSHRWGIHLLKNFAAL